MVLDRPNLTEMKIGISLINTMTLKMNEANKRVSLSGKGRGRGWVGGEEDAY